MASQKIIVPVDFTPASDQAIEQAILIANKTGCSITLFHVIENEIPGKHKTALSIIEDMLEALVNKIMKEDVKSDYSIATGSIFDEIPAFANRSENFMLVIGTHGIQSLKQKLLGAAILKIVRKIIIPCLIVQEECISNFFNPIVLPVGGHEGFLQLIEATARMARLFKAEIHLYSVTRKGDQEYEKIRENTMLAEKVFKERSVTYKRVKEDSSIVSVGYARQTLQFANTIDAGLIAIMSVKSEEHYYFAQADKETMINNQFNIPVLCTSGLFNY